MKLATSMVVWALFFAIAAPVCSAGTPNVALAVGATDLSATVPLCTYWYADGEKQGITPVMSAANNGFTPIAVSGVRLLEGDAAIRDAPCVLAPSGQANFVLAENPKETIIRKRAAKYAVIFTISRTGE